MKSSEERTLDIIIGKKIGPIPWEKALPLFILILKKVSHNHRKGIVHHTLKPWNIIVTPENKIKIAGLDTTSTREQTKTSKKKEALFYISPEQVSGETVDERSDIYSLGIILYEMLTGRLPFDKYEKISDFTLMNKIVSENPDDPREFDPSIPGWLVNIIYTAIAKQRSERIISADAFISLLKTEQEAFEKKAREEHEKEVQQQIEKKEFEKKVQEKFLSERRQKKEETKPTEQTPQVKKIKQDRVKESNSKKKKITVVLSLFFWIALALASFIIIYENKTPDNEWMRKNLNVDHYRNGDSIPEVKDQKKWAKLKSGAWCYYNNDKGNGMEYGKLYNWYAVNDPRGLAPEGWHIPTQKEFEELAETVNSNGDALKAMEQGSGTSKNGFSELLAGYRDSTGYFYDLGYVPYFWSSTEYDTVNACDLILFYHSSDVTLYHNNKRNGFSVRCLKDNKKQEFIHESLVKKIFLH